MEWCKALLFYFPTSEVVCKELHCNSNHNYFSTITLRKYVFHNCCGLRISDLLFIVNIDIFKLTVVLILLEIDIVIFYLWTSILQGGSTLADSGTAQLEFIVLSQRTGDPKYQQKVFQTAIT